MGLEDGSILWNQKAQKTIELNRTEVLTSGSCLATITLSSVDSVSLQGRSLASRRVVGLVAFCTSKTRLWLHKLLFGSPLSAQLKFSLFDELRQFLS